jgi:hypothetical protein
LNISNNILLNAASNKKKFGHLHVVFRDWQVSLNDDDHDHDIKNYMHRLKEALAKTLTTHCFQLKELQMLRQEIKSGDCIDAMNNNL